MDEKELTRKIKNSFKAGKSRAEIARNLQSRGYKLEYIDALIRKGKPAGKSFYLLSSLFVILLVAVVTLSYFLFLQTGEKQDLENPLANLSVNFAAKNANTTANPTEISIEDIEITPDYLSYILNEIGAWNLHKNPLTLSQPIINFKIDDQEFNSLIDDEITTTEGLSEDADIQFNTDKTEIVTAIISETPQEEVRDSVVNGRTTIETLTSDADLFAKGYLDLYNQLK